MRNNTLSILFSLLFGVLGGLAVGCGDDTKESDCAGQEMCECAVGDMCFSGLACVQGTCFPDTSTTTTTTDGTDGGTTGNDTSGGDPEQLLCEKTDECNLLMPGTSTQDCTDLVVMCTGELLSSQYSDWENEVADCLELSNCQNFLGCVGELSVCPSVTPADECTDECVYCFYDTELENMCPDTYNGDGECDCGCQFTDVDC